VQCNLARVNRTHGALNSLLLFADTFVRALAHALREAVDQTVAPVPQHVVAGAAL
jgi:hypothetical protein